jgi:hypothetical protein
VDLYIRPTIHPHGIVLRQLSTGATLLETTVSSSLYSDLLVTNIVFPSMTTVTKLLKSDADHSSFERRICEVLLSLHLHTFMASKVYTDVKEIHFYIFITDLNKYTTVRLGAATCIGLYRYEKAAP